MNTKKHTPESELIKSPLGAYLILNTYAWDEVALVISKDKLPLLAAAPEMLDLLKRMSTFSEWPDKALAKEVAEIIAKAEGPVQ